MELGNDANNKPLLAANLGGLEFDAQYDKRQLKGSGGNALSTGSRGSRSGRAVKKPNSIASGIGNAILNPGSIADAFSDGNDFTAEEEAVFQRERHLSDAQIAIKNDPEGARQSFQQLSNQDKAEDAQYEVKTHDQLQEEFNVNLVKGLSAADAATRLQEDGPNELKQKPPPTLLTLLLIQFANFVIVLLICSAMASLIIASLDYEEFLDLINGIAIMVIVFINSGIGAWTENSANEALSALANLSAPVSSVLRNGEEIEIPAKQIVRGDIVMLKTGDVVPADVRLLVSEDIKVNEMLLTGEPEDVSKKASWKPKPGEQGKLTPTNMVFSSCIVTNGNSRGIVVRTGMSTRIGEIATLLAGDAGDDEGCIPDQSANQTPLQVSLYKLGVQIGMLAIAVCCVVFVVGLLMETKNPADDSQESWMYMILISVTLAVAAIPEGIPLCVTISLSSGCTDMVSENVLVRKLAAVETLGSASIICTDKTGTLTEGKMTLVKMYTGAEEFNVTGKGFDPTQGTISHVGGSDGDGVKAPGVQMTLLSALLCSNTTLSQEENDQGNLVWKPKGNSSEAPLVVGAAKIGFEGSAIYAKYPRVVEVPFSSSRKMMLTCCKISDGKLEGLSLPSGTGVLCIVKGAPNYIMDICTEEYSKDGKIGSMSADSKSKIMAKVDELSSQALRVLAVAFKPMSQLPFDPKDDDIDGDGKFSALNSNLVFLGLVASIDPERDGVSAAVEDARRANVKTVMITGDYYATAVAIAMNCKILLPTDDATKVATDCSAMRPAYLNGEYLSNEEMDSLTRRTQVFARAKPEDKLEIVKSLQRQDFVCAMTGDGVNDAPALNEAAIGVAMGIAGTEVAKGASDMILTDDNFCSIVAAVNKGRVIYAGIQKFVAFIMSVHIAEVLQIFLCIVVQMPIMRQPLQILFLALVTDLPPAVALGMEPGHAGIMLEKPRPKKQALVQMWMWKNIVGNALILSAVILVCYIVALDLYVGDILQDSITSEYRNNCNIRNSKFEEIRKECCSYSPTEGVALDGGDFVPLIECFTSVEVGGSTYLQQTTDGKCGSDTENWIDDGDLTCRYRPGYFIPYDSDVSDVSGITPVNPLTYVVDLVDNEGWINVVDDNECECSTTGIKKAQTVGFIALVFSEAFRAYTARSFMSPVWVNTWANKSMQKAVTWSMSMLVVGTFMPGFYDLIMEFEYVDVWAWGLAFGFSVATLVGCEIYKQYQIHTIGHLVGVGGTVNGGDTHEKL